MSFLLLKSVCNADGLVFLCRAYTISIPMQIRAVMLRRVQILNGNKAATIFNLMSVFCLWVFLWWY